MINGVIFLQYFGSYGGSFRDVLVNLEQLGFFDYVLPFLVIFAIIFGILSKTTLFGENSRPINAIIAIAVGLMALQFGLVSNFFAELFPRFGVGLAIILVIMIMIGLFKPESATWFNYVMLGIAAIIVGAILVDSAGGIYGFGGSWWYNNWGSLLIGVLIIGALVAVFAGGGSSGKKKTISIPYSG